tara:strand:+ start:1466 stop:2437 length:972 start_codon:yes stop_codon:yes gene_type:complete
MNNTNINFINKFKKTQTKWNSFLKSNKNSKIRIRDAALQLNFSEAELLSTKINSSVKYLIINDLYKFFKNILNIEKLMFLTRNNYCVHEKIVLSKNIKIKFEQYITIFYKEKPLVIFDKNTCKFIFSEIKNHNNKNLKSFQFFNQSGCSILKIYVKSDDNSIYEKIVEEYSSSYNYEVQKKIKNITYDNSVLLKSILSKNFINNNEPIKFIKKINYKNSIRNILEFSSKKKIQLMIYVIGPSIIQFHFGKINKLVEYMDWYNILDPEFNLHLKDKLINNNIYLYSQENDNEKIYFQFINKKTNYLLGISPLNKKKELLTNIKS